MLMQLRFLNTKHGYIAGVGDGIVTINGNPASRMIYILDSNNLTWLQSAKSLPNGHYLVNNLDPNKKYLVICRDLPPNGPDQRYEPTVFDYVPPATDLTVAEQQALWQSWQDDATNTG